ncbi:MAG: hypothetical protein WBC55_03905, partial [Dehalococcoidia bacterium]
AKYGIISKQLAEAGERRISAAREMMQRMDDMLACGNLEDELPHLKPMIDEINWLPVSEKAQLELPVGRIKLKPWRTLWSWATGR